MIKEGNGVGGGGGGGGVASLGGDGTGSGLGSFGLVTSFSIGRTGFLISFGGLMTFGGEVSLSEGGVGGGVGEGDFKRSLGSVSSGDGKSRRASFS